MRYRASFASSTGEFTKIIIFVRKRRIIKVNFRLRAPRGEKSVVKNVKIITKTINTLYLAHEFTSRIFKVSFLGDF